MKHKGKLYYGRYKYHVKRLYLQSFQTKHSDKETSKDYLIIENYWPSLDRYILCFWNVDLSFFKLNWAIYFSRAVLWHMRCHKNIYLKQYYLPKHGI